MIAAFVVLAAMVPAAGTALGAQEVEAELPYTCAFPSGPQAVTVRVAARFPDSAAKGETIVPAEVTTTVELPEAAVAELDAAPGAEVRASTELAVALSQGEARAEASWRGTAQPATVPAEGPLVLESAGDVPSVTPGSAGELSLRASTLEVAFAMGPASGPADSEPEPSEPVSVSCSLAEGVPHNGLLATIPVTAGEEHGQAEGQSPSDEPGESARSEPKDPERYAPPPGRLRVDADAHQDAPPCRAEDPTPATLTAYVTGYSNVRKLDGSSLIPLSCMVIEQGISVPLDENFSGLRQPAEVNFSYEGRRQTPPAKATFLTYGFVPTTATMVLEQVGRVHLEADLRFAPYLNVISRIRASLVLRLSDVKVNGVSLDVGSDCRTKTPLTSPDPEPDRFPEDHMVLHGYSYHIPPDNAVGYMVSSGGPLTSEITIPAFTGCGTSDGEDLNRLLTASISGPGNYVKQIQGQACTPAEAATENMKDFCTPDGQPLVIPKPER
ncbi:DUF6801 domain-containing protein [Streptomyces sp. KE1]|uniref:DUF6801 domain-containing protein n=1 Tax=Streptomyces sp. KE1 TaxID=1638939 RepID=UPI002D21E713|nr:DUF6801 domain-containing protein [Streptomyces sp. KE1]